MLQNILLLLNALVAFSLVVVILLQRSDGGLGGAFGGAGGATGGSGGSNGLTRLTSILATIFLVNCLLLGVVSAGGGKVESVLNTAPVEEEIDSLPLPDALPLPEDGAAPLEPTS